MAKDAAADGRTMVVLVLADCDPAGHQMAVSIGRKLQALRDLLFPAMEFEVVPVALTGEQVRELKLTFDTLEGNGKESRQVARGVWRRANRDRRARNAKAEGNWRRSSPLPSRPITTKRLASRVSQSPRRMGGRSTAQCSRIRLTARRWPSFGNRQPFASPPSKPKSISINEQLVDGCRRRRPSCRRWLFPSNQSLTRKRVQGKPP